jgi:hypothetical protein
MRRLDQRHAAIAVLCGAAIAARLIVGAHIIDDAYITMRYSRNLSASGAMSYNPPDAVLGTSTPLWTWILAAGDAAGIAPERGAVAIATLADMTSIALILSSPAAGTFAALVSAATIAAWPAYVMYAVSGMETSLYVLTVVGFVSAMSRRRILPAAGWASLAALCRPDGALLVVLGSAWSFAAYSRAAGLRFFSLAAAFCAPWAAFAFVRFGSIVPTSVSAKAAAADPWLLSVQNLQAYFLQGPYAALTILAFAGFVVLMRTAARDSFFFLWSVWAVAYVVAMTAANGFTHFPWYFVPLLPIYTGSAAIAIERASSWLRSAVDRHGRHVNAGARHWDTALARGVAGIVLTAALLTRMTALKGYVEETAVGREKLYASVATELASVDARCTVAATEIGAIGYHYPGRVLDLVGLVSPEVIGRPVGEVLEESRARWLVTYDTHFDRAVATSDRFSRLFARRSTVRVGDSRSLEVYERRNPQDCGAR